MAAIRSNLQFASGSALSTDVSDAGSAPHPPHPPQPAPRPEQTASAASRFRRAAVGLSAASPESEEARRCSGEAAAALVAQAEAKDPRLARLLRPDPADASSVTWTVACYQLGDLSPSALRDFTDAYEAVPALACCPDPAHVAAELIASTGFGLRWTVMIRTGETVRFQLLARATSGDSTSSGDRALDPALERWADQLASWAIDPDQPEFAPSPALPVPSRTGDSGFVLTDSAVILGQVLEAVRGLADRVDAVERRLADLQLQLGVASMLSAERLAGPELAEVTPSSVQLFVASRRATNQTLAAAYARGRAVAARSAHKRVDGSAFRWPVPRLSGLGLAATVAILVLGLSACGVGGGKSVPGVQISVFHLKVGECLVPPTSIQAELSSVKVVPCRVPHTQEVYAKVDDSSAGDNYPGDTVLRSFADGQCLQQFEPYVGVDYRDSSLFYTYLLPSVRSWAAKDRTVVCVITTTGQQLTASVKGSRK